MILTLKRVADTIHDTAGVLAVEGNFPFALTMERQGKNNTPSVSCIPAGTYTCRRVVSHHFGNTFEVTDVEGRSHILFHKGNIQDDSHGCIIIGEQFERLAGKPAVLSSKHGYNQFMEVVASVDSFILKIREA